MSETCPRCESQFERFNLGTQKQFACKTILAANGNIRYRSPKCADLERVMWEARVASLTAQLDAAEQRAADLDRLINSAKLIATAECIDGVWWAKCSNGGVYGPQATECEVLLEVVEMRHVFAEARAEGLKAAFNPSCVCGGSIDKPNPDCERCDLTAQLAAANQKAEEAERERDEIKDKAIEQSEDVQRNWASPYEKVGMEGMIARLRSELAAAEAQAEGLAQLLKRIEFSNEHDNISNHCPCCTGYGNHLSGCALAALLAPAAAEGATNEAMP